MLSRTSIEQCSGSDRLKPPYFLWALDPFEHIISIFYLDEQALYHHCDIRGFGITRMYVHCFRNQKTTRLATSTGFQIRGGSAIGPPTGFLEFEDHKIFSG